MTVETYTEKDAVFEYGRFRYKNGVLSVNPGIPEYSENLGPGTYVLSFGGRQVIFRSVKKVKRLGIFEMTFEIPVPMVLRE